MGRFNFRPLTVPRLARIPTGIPSFAGISISGLITGAPVVTLGGHLGDWDEDGTGTSPATVTINSQVSGSSFAIVTLTDPGIYTTPTENKGNSSKIQLYESSGYAGGLWAPYGMEYYGIPNAAGGSSHTFQFTKTDTVRESTLIVIEAVGGPVIEDTSITNVAAAGAGVPYSSATVTTSGPALLIASWSGDGGTGLATQQVNVEAGWDMIESDFRTGIGYIQAAVAVKYVPEAGTYSVQWTPVANQGAILALSAHQPVNTSIPTVVASVFTGGAGAVVTTASRDTTGATVLLAMCVSQQATAPSIVDSLGNTWVAEGATSQFSTSFNGYVTVYRTSGAITVGAGHTLQFTGTVASSGGMIALRPTHGGTLTVGTWNKSIKAGGTPYPGPAVTPPQNCGILVAFGCHDGTGNPVPYDWSGSNFTAAAQELDASSFWTGSIATRVVKAAGPFTPSYAVGSGTPAGGACAVISVTEA